MLGWKSGMLNHMMDVMFMGSCKKYVPKYAVWQGRGAGDTLFTSSHGCQLSLVPMCDLGWGLLVVQHRCLYLEGAAVKLMSGDTIWIGLAGNTWHLSTPLGDRKNDAWKSWERLWNERPFRSSFYCCHFSLVWVSETCAFLTDSTHFSYTPSLTHQITPQPCSSLQPPCYTRVQLHMLACTGWHAPLMPHHVPAVAWDSLSQALGKKCEDRVNSENGQRYTGMLGGRTDLKQGLTSRCFVDY